MRKFSLADLSDFLLPNRLDNCAFLGVDIMYYIL